MSCQIGSRINLAVRYPLKNTENDREKELKREKAKIVRGGFGLFSYRGFVG